MGKTKNAQSESRKRLRESGSQTDEDSLQEEDSSGHCCEAKFAEVNTKLDKILNSLTELEALRDKVSSLEKESKDLKESAEFADLKSYSNLRLFQRGTSREQAYVASRRARLLEAPVNQVRILP